MSIPSDIEIAHAAKLHPIEKIAGDLGLLDEEVEAYGRAVAKVSLGVRERRSQDPKAKYVVVTGITPTPLGEGKTTTAVGLAQGLAKLGKRTVLTLRQPSMGPTFGIKGGGAGGGYSQVLPMEKLNLHLTGDFHAITAAHNLLAAMVDNHLFQGNTLGLDPRRISWRRVLDVNDRALRNIVIGLGEPTDGVPRQSGFDITSASEVGVIVALSTSLEDMEQRLGRIVVGQTYDGAPVTAADLQAAGAMAVILGDALRPNLMQTTENTPVLIHMGPFGNISIGNSSVIADQVGLPCAEYLLTESGFGSDMGFERLVNVKSRVSGIAPSAAVIVVTVRALKAHSGKFRIVAGKPLPDDLLADHPADVLAGAANLMAHIGIVRGFGAVPVVAINTFPTDHEDELAAIEQVCAEAGVRCARGTYVVDGGAGALALGQAVVDACEAPAQPLRPSYDLAAPLADKIAAVATTVYGAAGVEYAPAAAKQLAAFQAGGHGGLPVVIAKTHLSISSDPALKGAPTGWTLPVREVKVAAGAGYVYAIAGDMRTMPGLGKHPAAEHIDFDAHGEIVGLS
ncbi:MAG: formate--tetrahydrofolate ligase [Actinomycetia bacterium]|nr:formate--tetrahydrofolate ligase [Actinomycetes bacterium]